MSTCFTCKNHFNASSVIIPCSLCAKLYHATTDCTTLAASEIKVIQKRQMLLFRCPDCQSNGNSTTLLNSQSILSDLKDIKEACDTLPTLRSEFAEIKSQMIILQKAAEDVPQLKNQIVNINKRISGLESTNSKSPIDDEKFFTEMQDRITRANNIIIYNMKESNNIAEDLKQVKSTLDFAGVDLSSLKIKRIGKLNNNNNKVRPLVATLKSSIDVFTIFRNRSKLKQPLRVGLDKTKLQQQKFVEAKVELRERLAAGETNITIKYINNVPRVVSRDSVPTNSSKN